MHDLAAVSPPFGSTAVAHESEQGRNDPDGLFGRSSGSGGVDYGWLSDLGHTRL